MKLKDVVAKHGKAPENLIQILVDYQNGKDRKYISTDEVKYLSGELGISESAICSVITFYTLLSLKPRGRHIIQVCTDVPCHVNGSTDIVNELTKLLKIEFGQTTPDGIFTLEHTSCLGCCDRAPAMRIGECLYTGLTPEKIAGLIDEYRRKE